MSGTTHNNDGTKKRWNHGATLDKDGNVRFTSVSAIDLAASCLRRWLFAYGRWKLKDPRTKSSDDGDMYHGEVAQYLTTGSRAHLSSRVISGLSLVPKPGPDLHVELPLVPDLPGGKSGLEHAVLRASGIPVIGAVDLLHERPENYGVSDIMDMRDEPGLIKFVDWKFVGDIKNAKAGHELVDTFQMAGYGMWGFLRFPQLERVRLSHCYFPQRGSPLHSTAIVTRDQVEETWKHAEAVAVSMKHAAKESDPEKVDFNTSSCKRYGKECPALTAKVCSGPQQDTFAEYVGITQSERLIAAAQLVRPRTEEAPPTMTQPTNPAPNSILGYFQQPGAVQGTPQPASAPQMMQQPQYPQSAPPGVPQFYVPPVQQQQAPAMPMPQAPMPQQFYPQTTPPMPAPAPFVSPAQQVEHAQAAAAAAAQNAAILNGPAPTFDVLQIIEAIKSYGVGFPTLTGLAADYVGRLTNRVPFVVGTDGRLSGEGELARYRIPDINMLPSVLEETKRYVASRAGSAPMQTQTQAPATAKFTSPLPPDAPASNPTYASGPTPEEKSKAEKEAAKALKDAEKAAKKAEKEKAKADKEAEKLAKAQATQTQSSVAEPTSVAQLDNSANIVNQAPVEQTAPTIVNVQNVVAAPAAAAPSTPATTSESQPVAKAPSSGAINLYVDCAIEGLETISLHPIVEHIKRTMNSESGLRDFRMADRDHNFGAGKWEGTFAWMLRSVGIPPGNYSYDGAYSRIGSLVVETMRELVRETGGAFVKGAR